MLNAQFGVSINFRTRIKSGSLKRNFEIQAGEWDYVEVPYRDGSMIPVVANEVYGDDFNMFIVRSDYAKKVLLVGTVTEYDPQGIVWGEEKVSSIDDEYIVDVRGIMFIIFDNTYARSKHKSIDIDINVLHPPLEVGDEPLTESFEVDAGYVETIGVDVRTGDRIKIFGNVSKGNDITIHILSKMYETPDSLHLDKAYYTKEKVGEIEIDYECSSTEPLLIVFDNGYSLRTTKTLDVSMQIVRVAVPESGNWVVCPFCQIKNPPGSTICQNCKGKL